MKTYPIAFMSALLLCSIAPAQQEPIDSHTIIRSDSRLVLVDSVVTDKKGGYVHGLTQKDFKVWEDGKEQAISSFSFQADAPADSSQKHYLVLFFDNSTVSAANQVYARQAATKFIESNAGPNRLMSIVEFSGSLRVAQNFTDDVDRLKKVASGVKFASTAPNDTTLSRGFTNYSTRNVLGALRNMAKGLAQVPGRKTLVFLSQGFSLPADLLSELNAAIDACNHANVAVYPIDVRGLAGPSVGTIGPIGLLRAPMGASELAMLHAATLVSPLAFFQGRGGAPSGGSTAGGSSGGASAGGATGGGARAPSAPGGGVNTGGATTGGTGTRPTAPASPGNTNTGQNNNNGNRSATNAGGGNNNNVLDANRQNQNNRFRQLIPPVDNSIGGQQQVLYALASGTGGFVIANTNDLLGGMQKIGQEQNEYYVLGYVPVKELEPGACHTLKVKVDKGGSNVRFRTGYCDAKSVDVLSGTPTQRDLEARLTANATPTITATMQTPFFFISPNTARVSVVMDIPGDSLKFTKEKGKFLMKMNVVGIAYLPDGGIAARFSDSVKLTFDDKKQVEAFAEKPFQYEKQFEMASGSYVVKVVFSSSTEGFGKLEAPLTMEQWEPGKFLLSSLALGKSARPASAMGVGIDAELLDERVPLIVSGVQVTPTGTNHFRKSENGFIYAELYEPALAIPDQKEYPAMGVQVQVLDGKTDKLSKDLGMVRINPPAQTGNPAVPVGLKIPISELAVGAYKAKVTAMDALGREFTRTIGFDVDQ
jgi:VWFA-related protein